jgi:fermentation-respiration switch protein FrsA (DUF1100 family)
LRKFFQAPDARVAHLPVITNAAQPLRTRRQMMTRTASRLAASLTGLLLSTSAFAADFSTKRVEFLSGEDVVVGTLYVPGKAKTPSAAVLVEGPQTNHRDMVPATYAAKLASAGFVALTFDHRTFGESGGRFATSRTRP